MLQPLKEEKHWPLRDRWNAGKLRMHNNNALFSYFSENLLEPMELNCAKKNSRCNLRILKLTEPRWLDKNEALESVQRPKRRLLLSQHEACWSKVELLWQMLSKWREEVAFVYFVVREEKRAQTLVSANDPLFLFTEDTGEWYSNTLRIATRYPGVKSRLPSLS